MKKWMLGFIALILLIAGGLWALPSQSCNGLTWNANTESDLAGYKVYWRTATTTPYTDANSFDRGNTVGINFDAQLPAVGTALRTARHYFAVTAYDNATPRNESGFSTEVSCKRPPAAVQGVQTN